MQCRLVDECALTVPIALSFPLPSDAVPALLFHCLHQLSHVGPHQPHCPPHCSPPTPTLHRHCSPPTHSPQTVTRAPTASPRAS